MRNVFNALMKIIGLRVALNGCQIFVLTFSHRMAYDIPPTEIAGTILGVWLINLGISFIAAWLLIFKTDWLADKVKVPKDEHPGKPLERSELFPLGIQLLGFYLLFSTIPNFIQPLLIHAEITVTMIPWVIQICLSVIYILKADAIVKFVADKANAKWTKVVAIVLLACGLLAVVVSALGRTR